MLAHQVKIMDKQDIGDIYMLISPSGKKYVGQAVSFLPSGRKHGYIQRWKQHVYEAKTNKECSVLLDNAIRKYEHTTFQVILLKTCPISELDYWENYYIVEHNTLSPKGYNLTTGKSNSRQSAETIEKRRTSMMGKNKGRILTKRIRQREEDANLPKYVRYYKDSSGKEGYRVSHHPTLKEKSFLGKTLSLETKLDLALQYLHSGIRSLNG
jgi:Asp-tRNA(Asn)/Glu-tRNA(Gln) amidotransferase A subunit family amidase